MMAGRRRLSDAVAPIVRRISVLKATDDYRWWLTLAALFIVFIGLREGYARDNPFVSWILAVCFTALPILATMAAVQMLRDRVQRQDRAETDKALNALRQDMEQALASVRTDLERDAAQWRDMAQDLAKTPGERIQRGHITPAERWAVKVRCEFQCQYCGGEGDEHTGPDGRPWHIDHIIPVTRGGPSVRENLTLACHTCNLRKGDRPVYLFASRPARRARRGRR